MGEQVPLLNPSQIGRYTIYLPLTEGKAGLTLVLVMYLDRSFTCPHTVTHATDFDPTGSGAHDPLITSPTCHRYATKPQHAYTATHFQQSYSAVSIHFVYCLTSQFFHG